MKKRMLTMFLTICMIFTMLPVGALAKGTPLAEPVSMGESASPSSFTQDALAVQMLAGGITTKEDLVTALGAGGYGDVVLGGNIDIYIDLSTDQPLNVGRDVILDLNGHSLGIKLSMWAGHMLNGIKIASGVTLTIRDSSASSTGTLTVKNQAVSDIRSGNGAAINTTGGTLVIEGGTVIANGGSDAAGIGGGLYGDGGTITISGGTVTATGGSNAAGIGGGNSGLGATVNITGGTVTATGGSNAAGIGGGSAAPSSPVTINSGTVTAKGGVNGAGIGGGFRSYCNTVTVNGGMVTATGGSTGAGIGGAVNGSGGTVTINAGTVIATGGEHAPGIGGTAGASGGTTTINGGEVTANGGAGAAGIGGGYAGGNGGTVIITGGIVTATGKLKTQGTSQYSGAGIGGGGAMSGTATVTITGGTVKATGSTNAAGIGGGAVLFDNWSYDAPGSCTITGGSVQANNRNGSNFPLPKNSGGQPLYLATLTVAGGSLAEYPFPNGRHVVKPQSGYYAYGTKDLKTDLAGQMYFWLPADTYAIALKAGAQSFANSAVTVVENSGGTADLTSTINAAPIDILLSVTSIARNAAVGTAIGTFSTTDMDGNDKFSYTLVTGEGSDDNSLFTIAGNTLKLGSSLDSVADSSLTIRVRTTDVSSNYYEKTLIITVLNVPGAPTIGTATAGNGSAIVSFTAPSFNGGAAITGYTVTANPGGATGTGVSSPITVTGLTSGIAYTFTVTATNSVGTGAASAASSSVTPKNVQTITFENPGPQNFGTTSTLAATSTSGLDVTFTSLTPDVASITGDGTLTFLKAGTATIRADQAGDGYYFPASAVSQTFSVKAVVPGAPTIGEATLAGRTAKVAFTPPDFTGGANITSYTVTSSPGNITASGTVSPITVTGLEIGTVYTFTVAAKNSAGTGAASAASNSIMPVAGPEVTSVGVPANKTYAVGQSLEFTVNFDQESFVTGAPQIALTIGSATRYAQYLSGSGTTSLTFRYAVTAGDADASGITVGALSLNSGSIQNALGSDATLILNSIGSTAGILVDGVAPAISSVVPPPNGTYGPGQNLDFTVYFSENVIVTGTPQIAITVGGSTAYARYLSSSGTSALLFRYTVAAGQEDSNGIAVGALDPNGGTVRDAAGNDADLTLNNVGSLADVRVDGAAPAAPCIALTSSSDTGMSNADGITNDTTPTFAGTAEAGSTLTLYEDATVIGSATADGSGNWSVAVSAFSDGVYSITATAMDAMGNISAASAALTIMVDTQAPTLSVSPADGAVNIATDGNIILTFGEGMDHLTPGMVQLDGTPKTGAWNAGNITYTVPYSGLSSRKNYTLTIADFRDVAGNALPASVSRSFTTAAAQAGGSGNAIRTLTDVPTGLTVSGALSGSATLRVNSFTPAHNSTDPALAAMRKRMDSLTDTLIFCADITVSGNYSGPLTLSFTVGDQYNGQTVTLLHAKNGKLITYTAIVKNGIATFIVTSLSPFALFAPVTALDAVDIPKTGDGGMRYEAMAASGILALCAVSQCFIPGGGTKRKGKPY